VRVPGEGIISPAALPPSSHSLLSNPPDSWTLTHDPISGFIAGLFLLFSFFCLFKNYNESSLTDPPPLPSPKHSKSSVHPWRPSISGQRKQCSLAVTSGLFSFSPIKVHSFSLPPQRNLASHLLVHSILLSPPCQRFSQFWIPVLIL